jgi:ribosomal-protein-alanine N-acetyltransferase
MAQPAVDLDIVPAGRFQLRPFAPSDLPDLLAHFSDPETVRHMDIDPIATRADAEEIVDWARALRARGEGVRWAIRDADGAFAGSVGFNTLTYDRAARGEIAYDVVRARWRTGVMDEVLPAVLAFAFGPLALHRVYALVDEANPASRRLLEKHGFACEGLLRGHGYWKGVFHDELIYARLATD